MGNDGTQNGLRVPVDRVAKRGELVAVFNIVDHADLILVTEPRLLCEDHALDRRSDVRSRLLIGDRGSRKVWN